MQSPLRQLVTTNSDSNFGLVNCQFDEDGSTAVDTPHLGSKNAEKVANTLKANGVINFLDKHNESGSIVLSNHLYRFNNQILKKDPGVDSIKNMSNQAIKADKVNDAAMKKTELEVLNKRLVQRTPISSNPRNYIESFKFETPVSHNEPGKLLKFATPSTGAESLTTATSMRKISDKMAKNYGVQSPEDS